MQLSSYNGNYLGFGRAGNSNSTRSRANFNTASFSLGGNETASSDRGPVDRFTPSESSENDSPYGAGIGNSRQMRDFMGRLGMDKAGEAKPLPSYPGLDKAPEVDYLPGSVPDKIGKLLDKEPNAKGADSKADTAKGAGEKSSDSANFGLKKPLGEDGSESIAKAKFGESGNIGSSNGAGSKTKAKGSGSSNGGRPLEKILETMNKALNDLDAKDIKKSDGYDYNKLGISEADLDKHGKGVINEEISKALMKKEQPTANI